MKNIIPPLAYPSAEREVIATVIAKPGDALGIVLGEGVTLEMFSDPTARQAYAIILGRHASGGAVSAGALIQDLAASADIDTMQALALTEAPPLSTLNLTRVCALLRECHQRRETIRWARVVAQTAEERPEEVGEAMTRLLEAQSGAQRAKSWRAIVAEVEDEARRIIAGEPQDANRLTWGWESLDRRFGKLARQEMIILAGRPSLGKSSALRQICLSAALSGKRVLLETLEVSPRKVVDQLGTGLAGVPFGRLGQLHHDDQQAYLAALAKLRPLPLQVQQDRSLAGIVARATAAHECGGLDLLCVDYLTLISDCSSRDSGDVGAIGRVTARLKQLALDLNTVVVIGAQLNRESVKGGDNREPVLADLRGSGSIEQDADVVVMLHRPNECIFRKTPQDILDSVADQPRFSMAFIMNKNRNGSTGFAPMWFRRELARFEDPTLWDRTEVPDTSAEPMAQFPQSGAR